MYPTLDAVQALMGERARSFRPVPSRRTER
jgi:hypothetical protein